MTNVTYPAPQGARAALLITACLCQLLVVIDLSIVNVALPSIGSDLEFSASSLQWVVTAYAVAFGGLLLLGGRLCDVIGARRTVVTGFAIFAVASTVGGLAGSPHVLIAARAAQGAAAAVLAPASLSLIIMGWRDEASRHRAMAAWGAVSAGGGALGVLAGGVLTGAWSWRWVLLANVPVALIGVLLAVRSIERNGGTRARLDLAGSVVGTAALTALVYGVVEASTSRPSWSAVGAALSLAVALGYACVVLEGRQHTSPLLRLSLARDPRVVVLGSVIALLGAAMTSVFYFSSLFLQEVQHHSPVQSGLRFLPFCCGIVVGSIASRTAAQRFPARSTMLVALTVGLVGTAWYSQLRPSTGFSSLLGASVLASAGIGAAFVTATTCGSLGVQPSEEGMVSGLLNCLRQCGGALGLAAASAAAHHGSHSSAGAFDVSAYVQALRVAAGLLVIAIVVLLASRDLPALGYRPEPEGQAAV